MLPSSEVLKSCLHLLSQNQIIVLPLNGIYYLASLPSSANEQSLRKLTQNSTPIEYLFASYAQVTSYVIPIPSWSYFLVKEVLPNHVTCLLPGLAPKGNFSEVEKTSPVNETLTEKNNSDSLPTVSAQKTDVETKWSIYCNQTSHPYTQKLLESLETPLIIVKAILADLPPAITLSMLKDYFGDSIHYFLPPKYMITGVGPTVVDLTNPDKLTILEPGILEKKDFMEFIPYQIAIEENFQIQSSFSVYHSHKPIILTNSYQANKKNNAVVIGTKEKLRDVFGLAATSSLFDYHNKIYQGQVLLNLGSQTNLENVARHLAQKIHEASYFGMNKIVLLNQNWGKSKWGKIISFYLEKYTKLEETMIGQENTVQELIIPKTGLVKKLKNTFNGLKIPKIGKVGN